MRITAPAKINWTLEVLGRRSDGYHEVRTILQTIDLCDEIFVEPADSLIVTGSPAKLGDDLIARAARALAKSVGREPPGASIRVKKRIPVAAGLGGGSSDAAAAMRALNRIWKLGLSPEALAGIAADLGSDVPFFLSGGTALGEGRGEQVEPLPDPARLWLVLLVPPISIDGKTRRLYASLGTQDFSDGSHTNALSTALRQRLRSSDAMFYNAFESVAYETVEGLAHYRDALLSAGAQSVHLTGSGPALFALARDERQASEMRDRLRGTSGQAYAVRTLTAAESTVISEE